MVKAKDTKSLLIVLIICVYSSFTGKCYSQQQEKDTLPTYNLNLGFDLQTKYLWRGMEIMPTNSSPVIFPTIGYSYNNICAYVVGGYALNGLHSEVDWGISYTYKCFTVGVNDYYYPSLESLVDQLFNYKSATTNHWIEGVFTITPNKFPGHITISNFFYGADKDAEGQQAYSTYAEAGYSYALSANRHLSLTIGAALNASCYNGYEQGGCICNVELKYTRELQLNKDLTLPLSVAYIVNPTRKKSFVNLTTSLTL